MLSTLHHDYNFGAHDRFLHHSSICFDLSIVQIFSALTAGAALYVASAAVRKDPPLLASFMRQFAVTVTYFTPSQFALLLEYAKGSLKDCRQYRIAFFAGERLPARVAKAFYDLETPATLYNTWSPSELVVQTTIHETAYPDAHTINIPIGYPLANCRHYITDSQLNPLPSGLIGEICVGGAQVGAGYLNRPDAIATSFVENPFCEDQDQKRGWTKLFRTGDKGRFLSDGQLEFHSRIAGDKQVKLRGFRIDLAEVEQRLYLESSTEQGNALVDISVVARAVNTREIEESDSGANATGEMTDNRQLVAFIVPRDRLDIQQKQAFVTSIHEKIGVHLNTYMLPNGYQFLDNLPVTIGGKVDRQNLLGRNLDLILPSSAPSTDRSTGQGHQGVPDKILLQVITNIFREVLKLPKEFHVAPTDNFFKLGGQSILLLRLQAKIKRAFKTPLTLTDLFKAPTPAGVCGVVSATSRAKDQIGRGTQQNATKVNWAKETTLPNESRYKAPVQFSDPINVTISDILLTGVDSFIGVHMLQTLLLASRSTRVHVIGTLSELEHPMLVDYLRKYNLLSESLTEATVLSRVYCIPGVLAKPHFGLDAHAFKGLGQQIQAIYHLGGQVSLLKTYTDLKPLNVSTILDIIELAACGKNSTKIHHLSTWSVPHLQTWSTTKRTEPTVVTSEVAPTHFSPPATDEFGYFKSRWVSEMLMMQASARGFPVSIYRASAVTASTSTNVPEPADDFIRRMVLGMIEVGVIPTIGNADPQFAVDFIPVNYLVGNMYKLSNSDVPTVRDGQPSIYHVGNPKPLPLHELPSLMGDIRNDQTVGRSASLEEWYDVVSKNADEDDQMRWTVLKDYLRMGHIMFALDDEETNKMIQRVGWDLDCPPLDAAYLRKMWINGRIGEGH
ncbi:MAG: hypothetical protein Q9181_007374 [Wetmoreana brouardii]